MENPSTENKLIKKMEAPQIEIVRFGGCDIVTTSEGCISDSSGNNCPSNNGDACGTHCGNDTCTECLAAGTKIRMADGSVKKIEDIAEGDRVLSFDHRLGAFVGSPVMYAYKGDAPKCAVTLLFADGNRLSIVGEHDLFEQESNRYVTLTEENAETFIGRHFYSADEKGYVALVDVKHETEAVDYYELYAAKTLNTVANGMLNVADDVDYLLNIYEFDENLKASEKALARDILKYGLFPCTEQYGFTAEECEAWNMRYLSVATGKGLTTLEAVWEQHAEYLTQRDGIADSTCA